VAKIEPPAIKRHCTVAIFACVAALAAVGSTFAADGRAQMRCTHNVPCPPVSNSRNAQTPPGTDQHAQQPVVRLRTLDLTALPAGAFGDTEPETQLSTLPEQRIRR
jgi:hypothetical protein